MGSAGSCIHMKFSNQTLKRLRPLLGTYVAIKLQGEAEEKLLNECITEGFTAVAEIDQLMSYHRADSDLTRLNQARPNEWVEVHVASAEVLTTANQLFLLSDGAFDIRCGGVLADHGILPALSHNEYGHSVTDKNELPLEIRGSRVRKSGPWLLDLGGIAKGYAVDHAVKRMQRLAAGWKIFGMVNAGGDLRVWGDQSISTAIRIYGKSFSRLQPLSLNRTAVATSFVRKRSSKSKNLTAAAHVRMPSGDLYKKERTVTVFAQECLLADALTKVVLLADLPIAEACLSTYNARALIFGQEGQIEQIIG